VISGNYTADRLCLRKDCWGIRIFTVSSCPHQVILVCIITASIQTKDFLVHAASKKSQPPRRSQSSMHISGHFSAAFSSESVEWAGEKAVPWLGPTGETNPWIAPSPPRAQGNSAALLRESSFLHAQISFAKPRRRKQALTAIIKIAAYFRRVITLLSTQAINLTDNNAW